MKAMKSVKVESSLLNKELVILWETDLGITELGVMITRSRADGWYFVLLRDECGHFLEVMEMTDKSTNEYKVFRSTVEHAFGVYEVEVTIDVEHRRWAVELR